MVITVTGSIDDWELTVSLDDPDNGNPGLVGMTNSSEKEKEKADDANVGSYIVKDGALDGTEENVTIDFYTTFVEGDAQP